MNEELMKQIEALKAENEALKNGKSAPGVNFKVTDKGGLSVYGLGRFPVTLYVEQWERLLSNIDKLKAFIEENRTRFSLKEKK